MNTAAIQISKVVVEEYKIREQWVFPVHGGFIVERLTHEGDIAAPCGCSLDGQPHPECSTCCGTGWVERP